MPLILTLVLGLTGSAAAQKFEIEPGPSVQRGRAAQLRYEIIDLGYLNAPGLPNLYVYASSLNDHGVAVGSIVAPLNGRSYGFIWQDGMMTELLVHSPGVFIPHVIPQCISNGGHVSGHARASFGNDLPVRWSDGPADGFILFGFPGSPIFGRTHGVNDSGKAVGSSAHYFANRHGFVWELGTMTDIGVLPGSAPTDRSVALGINSLGEVACYSGFPGSSNPCLWQSGQAMIDLGIMPGYSSAQPSESNCINNLAHVVGWSTGQGQARATLWSNGQIIDLGYLPTSNPNTTASYALGINDRDEIVGISNGKAFLWRNGRMFDLNDFLQTDSDWSILSSAVDINEHGWILGKGIRNGFNRSFIMKPVLPVLR